jgi:polyisoprenoid-binding protein YceI
MRKFYSLLSALVIAMVFASCSGNKSQESTESTETENTETTEAMEATFAVDPEASVVAWKGEVVGVYGHNGVIGIQNGSISAKGEQLTGGEIVIDMTTIVPLDSASYKDEDGSRASDLVGHLSTGDFFLVEEYPTASFKIKSHSGNQLVGDLTIRGNTKEETAEIKALNVSEDGLTGEATLVFNRQEYDVNWEHFVKDYVLSDDITIDLTIVANK